MKRIKIIGITLVLSAAAAMTSLAEGWKNDNGIWYYVKADGSLAVNEWIEEDGFPYYLQENGALDEEAVKRYQEFLESFPDGFSKDQPLEL